MSHPNPLRIANAFLLTVLLASPLAHSGETSSKGLVYATAGRHKLKLDLFYPATPPPPGGYPLIISIHGGGWLIGDRHKDLFLRSLTNDGYAIASIDYRLSCEAKFPAQIDDSRQALHWLIANAPTLHLNAKCIGVTGASAGAHLALLLGLDPKTSPNPIKAICALYPPTDLVSVVPPENRDRDNNLVAKLLGGPVTEHFAQAREGSPITHVSSDAPPVLLIHGDEDTLVPLDQSRTLNLALRRAGANSSLIILQGKGHGFSLQRDTLHAVTKFFDRALKK